MVCVSYKPKEISTFIHWLVNNWTPNTHAQNILKLSLHTSLKGSEHQGPVVQSVVSLTSSLRVISLTVLADSIYNILKFFAEKMWVLEKSYSQLFSKKFQHICDTLDVNFNEFLTNDVVSFEQLGPEVLPQIARRQLLQTSLLLLASLCFLDLFRRSI